jgi:putative GTP pyrophosphokinase
MRISKKLQQFLHEYEQYFRHVLKPTYDEVKKYLKQLEDSSLWNLNTIGSTTVNQSPIRMTMIRIKRPEATVDKISRSPDKFPDGLSSQSLKKMCDTIGVRILVYKPENRANFSAKRRFEILSRELNVIDEHFNLLYEEFLQRRETVKYGNTDMLNSENLPAILAEIGIKCSLKDHYDIIKILSSRGINTVGDIIEIATPDRIEAIRNMYFSSTGHAPGHLEILAILGSIKGAKTVSAEIERIKVQIEYHRSWNTFKKELSNRRLHQKQEA